MLNVLQHHALSDVVAVVTRYFGGIKLGAGGLVRAYSEAVAHATAEAGTQDVVLSQLLRVDVPMADAGAMEAQLRGLVLPDGTGVIVDGVDWGASARITMAVPVSATAELHNAISSLSCGTLHAVTVGQRWADAR